MDPNFQEAQKKVPSIPTAPTLTQALGVQQLLSLFTGVAPDSNCLLSPLGTTDKRGDSIPRTSAHISPTSGRSSPLIYQAESCHHGQPEPCTFFFL